MAELLSMANLTAIHWLHRLGALVTFCCLPGLAELALVPAGCFA